MTCIYIYLCIIIMIAHIYIKAYVNSYVKLIFSKSYEK